MGFMEGYNMTAGNRQMRMEQSRLDLAMRQFAEQRDDEAKRLAQTSKAAETFVKANPGVLGKLGMTDQEFANLSASEQIGVVDGYYKSQAMKQVMQELAQRERQMQADQTFADTLENRTRTQFTMPPVGSDPTGMVAFAGMPSRTATTQRVPTRDDLLAAMAAAPLSGASKELLNYHLLQGGGEGDFKFIQDDKTGHRFLRAGNTVLPSGVDTSVAAPTASPMVSPDGRFYHDGKKWVAIKQLGYPEGSTIVTENGQTVIKGPDGRILTTPRGQNLFSTMFGGGGEGATPTTSAPAAPHKAGGPATINSQAEYDALPSGAEYQDSQGNIRRKK